MLPSTQHKQLEIHPVPPSAYRCFAAHHYRGARLGPTAGAWCALLDGRDVAIVTYAHAGLGARARKAALARALWGGPLAERVVHLRDNLRVLQRLVVLPEYRGQGIGSRLVAATLAQVGVPFIEAMALNPRVLERAGMTRVACSLSQQEERLLAWLKARGLMMADLTSADRRLNLLSRLETGERDAARHLIARALRDWKQSHGSGQRDHGRVSLAAFARFWQGLQARPHYLFWRYPLPWD